MFPALFAEIDELHDKMPFTKQGDAALCDWIDKTLTSHICDNEPSCVSAELGCALSCMTAYIYDRGRPRVFTHLIRYRPTWIHHGGDLNYTVLHCAATYQPQYVAWVVEILGADVNAVRTDGGRWQVPLDGAYDYMETFAVKTLLRNGANVTTLGKRKWRLTQSFKEQDTSMYRVVDNHTVTTLVLRAYYLNIVHSISKLHADHYRLLMDMLVPVFTDERSSHDRAFPPGNRYYRERKVLQEDDYT